MRLHERMSARRAFVMSWVRSPAPKKKKKQKSVPTSFLTQSIKKKCKS